MEFQIGFGRPIVALDHLTAWWKFDEGNGSVVHDYLGKFSGTFAGHAGALPSFDSVQAKFGSSLYFPQNAWVTTDAFASSLGIDQGNPRTISFWMHAEDQEQPGGPVPTRTLWDWSEIQQQRQSRHLGDTRILGYYDLPKVQFLLLGGGPPSPRQRRSPRQVGARRSHVYREIRSSLTSMGFNVSTPSRMVSRPKTFSHSRSAGGRMNRPVG